MNRRPMLVVSAVVLVAQVALGAWAWLQLPADAQIPVHWGVDGTPDVYAGKTIGLIFVPILTAALIGVFAVIPRIEPRRANLERSAKAYGATWIAAVLLVGGLQVLVVAAAMGAEFDMSRIVIIGIGALFIVVGNYLPKVRPNYLMGIRTPWTLTSDVAWVKTHRVGGRLFVLEGLIMVALGVLGVTPAALIAAIVVAIGLVLVVVFVYSYRVWKQDPERRTA